MALNGIIFPKRWLRTDLKKQVSNEDKDGVII